MHPNGPLKQCSHCVGDYYNILLVIGYRRGMLTFVIPASNSRLRHDCRAAFVIETRLNASASTLCHYLCVFFLLIVNDNFGSQCVVLCLMESFWLIRTFFFLI